MKGDTCLNSCDNFPNINCYYANMFGATAQDSAAICNVANDSIAENEACFIEKSRDACFQVAGCAWVSTDPSNPNVNGFCTLGLPKTGSSSGHFAAPHASLFVVWFVTAFGLLV